jgi:hypothetical protein
MKLLDKKSLSRIIRPINLRLISNKDLQLLNTVKRELLPPNYNPREYYVPQGKIGHAGFQLNMEPQLELLRSFQKPEFQALFEILRNDEEINVGFMGKDYKGSGLIHNGYYPTPDAEIYAAMITLHKPDKIIEIGSGYSTVIARTAVEHIGLKCKIHVIDPQPRRNIENYADHIEYKPVEFSSLAEHAFSDNTLLFIDSSHVCRSQGDVPFLYCRILPSLSKHVLIHIHDIFLPYDYPDNYFAQFFNEQYLLHALLVHSRRFEVVFATHFLTREHPEAMQTVFGTAVGVDALFFGASFWIKMHEKPDEQNAVTDRHFSTIHSGK